MILLELSKDFLNLSISCKMDDEIPKFYERSYWQNVQQFKMNIFQHKIGKSLKSVFLLLRDSCALVMF